MSVWVEAARPRTLPASIAPVLVGTAAAQRFIAWRAGAALVVALALQVAVNYANDLFDARKGVDTELRVGPRRAVASGLASPRAMGIATAVALVVAAVAGLALVTAAGWELLLVGVAAILAALAYSGGPKPYASAGLGEVMVFLFFGLVATAGSAYVQDEQLRLVPVVAAIPMGCVAAAILVVNNLRDLSTDRTAGKTTLAVRLGERRTVLLYRGLIVAAVLAVPLVAWAAGSLLPLIALVPFMRAVLLLAAVHEGAEPPRLIAALAGTALFQLMLAVFLAAGLWTTSR